MSQIDLTKAESDWVEAMVLGAALLRGDLAGVFGVLISYFVLESVDSGKNRHKGSSSVGVKPNRL